MNILPSLVEDSLPSLGRDLEPTVFQADRVQMSDDDSRINTFDTEALTVKVSVHEHSHVGSLT